MKKLTRAQRKRKRLRELDGAFSGIIGAELVSNGDFATDPAVEWTLGNGWTWDSLKELMESDGADTNLTQTLAISDTKSYLLEFDVVGTFETKGLKITFGGRDYDTNKTGRFSSLVKANGGVDIAFSPQLEGYFVGDIDNVSVREII